MSRVTDVQNMDVIEVDDRHPPTELVDVEVLIVGGGLGGVAAAIAACRAGRTVCLTEETDWLGGQATSQAVTALDENGYIETTGATRTYQDFRNAIREDYRRNTRLKPTVSANPRFSPGRNWGRLAFEPRAAVRVIDEMLAPFLIAGKLRILKKSKPYAVAMEGPRVQHVDLVDLDSRRTCRVRAIMFIDATELGDLLVLGAADFVIGAESRDQTTEPHAADTSDPEDVQSVTYCVMVDHRPGDRPSSMSRPITSVTAISSPTPSRYITAMAAYSPMGSLRNAPERRDRSGPIGELSMPASSTTRATPTTSPSLTGPATTTATATSSSTILTSNSLNSAPLAISALVFCTGFRPRCPAMTLAAGIPSSNFARIFSAHATVWACSPTSASRAASLPSRPSSNKK